MQICAHKSANKATFALSDFVLLLVCHIGRLVLNSNPKKPFVAICFGFREKIASLTGLLRNILCIRLPMEKGGKTEIGRVAPPEKVHNYLA